MKTFTVPRKDENEDICIIDPPQPSSPTKPRNQGKNVNQNIYISRGGRGGSPPPWRIQMNLNPTRGDTWTKMCPTGTSPGVVIPPRVLP